MEAEMHELMGDDAVTVTDRTKAPKTPFDVIQTAAGRYGKYDKNKEEEISKC